MPEADPIWASCRAAEAGDVDAYLACFVPPALSRLQAELARQGIERFRRGLKANWASARSLTIQPLEAPVAGRSGFRVTVGRESDRELFDYLVVRDGAKWRICTVVPCGREPNPPPQDQEPEPPAEQGDPK